MRQLVLLALCGCTQDFGAFEPQDASSDASIVDSGDSATVTDSAAETASDTSIDGAVACSEAGAITFGGHCYFLATALQTGLASQTNCMGSGAHLATLTGSAEQAAVIVLGAGTERWIGLLRKSGTATDANYTWVTNEPRAGFAAWSPGEPNGSGQCVRLLADGLWADDDCTNPHASICERE